MKQSAKLVEKNKFCKSLRAETETEVKRPKTNRTFTKLHFSQIKTSRLLKDVTAADGPDSGCETC